MKTKLITFRLWGYPLLLVLVLLGCSKAQTLVKILGTWEMVNVTDVDSDVTTNWLFDVDDIMVITNVPKYLPDSVLARWEGRYEVKVRVYKRYVKIYGFEGGMDYMNAEWEIVKSNKDVLILASNKEGGLLIKEFVKKKF
ncbi:MAG: hypothetical protein NTU44_07315 [Bacteroidetes bacterium]|nr:hypothetical protein [Bacteroidota bacterium]